MSSRSLSPPLRSRGWRGGGPDRRREPLRSSRRFHPYLPGRRAASMPALPPSDEVSRDQRSASPPLSFASVVRQELSIPPQPEPQYEENSGSEVELYSPPHLKIIPEAVAQELGSPTSPRCSPSCINTNPSLSLEGFTFGSDTEDMDAEEDACFNSRVDDFTNAVADLGKYTPEDDIDFKAIHQRRTKLFAETALKFYNSDEKNKIKYELTHAIASCGIMEKGFHAHVNFTAKGNLPNSENELFFAELHKDGGTYITTCVLSLMSVPRVGGLRGSKYDNFNDMGLPIDAQHCYACDKGIKHPKSGELYESGHVARGDYYYW